MRKKARKKPLGSIRFVGNPWPHGHALVDAAWLGHIDDEGAWFDLHLETEDYYARDRPLKDGEVEDDGRDDWTSKGCWSNYHRCTLSSTSWGDEKGFLVGTEKKKFAWAGLVRHTFKVDPTRSFDNEEAAFHVYLLGHDSVAGHEIRFDRLRGGTYAISWRGKIALSYSGDDVFRYRFEANVRSVAFAGFVLPEGTEKRGAMELGERFLAKPGDFVVKKSGGRSWLVPARA